MSRYRRAQVHGGCYFFTVNLANRESTLLIEHIDVLRVAYQTIQHALPFETIAICVLPDHLHALWPLPPQDHDFSPRWQRIKAMFSSAMPMQVRRSPSKRIKREKGVWQRRFWEHVIRDESDLQKHVDYIHHNPVKHGLVKQVVDWLYSSFHRYVRRGELASDWAGSSNDDDIGYGE
jgi:putative transposase